MGVELAQTHGTSVLQSRHLRNRQPANRLSLTAYSAKLFNLTYEDAAPTAMIGASNHFEVAIATSVMLFGLSSGAALATVVGVLIEVPVMLMLVGFCKRTCGSFRQTTAEELNF